MYVDPSSRLFLDLAGLKMHATCSFETESDKKDSKAQIDSKKLNTKELTLQALKGINLGPLHAAQDSEKNSTKKNFSDSTEARKFVIKNSTEKNFSDSTEPRKFVIKCGEQEIADGVRL